MGSNLPRIPCMPIPAVLACIRSQKEPHGCACQHGIAVQLVPAAFSQVASFQAQTQAEVQARLVSSSMHHLRLPTQCACRMHACGV
eukprot:366162-Chlamydomonas_euryale.AAC.3